MVNSPGGEVFVPGGPWLMYQVVECLCQVARVNVPGGGVFVSGGLGLMYQVVEG